MPTTYDMTIPIYLRAFNNLQHILQKAEKWAEENNVDKKKLTEARLIEDMRPLPFQIQSASNTAKLAIVRITGVANEPWDDNETTFPEFYARIEKTIAFLKKVEPSAFEGKEEAEVVMKLSSGEMKFTGLSYLQTFALPNFFFHHTAAYSILRAQGVPVGKFDYLGRTQ